MNLKEIETPALHKLDGYLEAVSEFIRTGELKWYFEVKLFECEEPVSDVGRLIIAAYPDAKLEKAEIPEASAQGMVETLEHELGRFCPEIEALRMLGPISTFTAAMWSYLSECIDYEHARIFEYFSSEKDSLLNGIAGDFAFIIYNERLHRCLILSGATCD